MTTPPPGSREAAQALDEIERHLSFIEEMTNPLLKSDPWAIRKEGRAILAALPTLRAALAPPADGAGEVEAIRARHEYAEQKGGDLYTPEYCEWSFSQCHADRATLLSLLSEERARRVEGEMPDGWAKSRESYSNYPYAVEYSLRDEWCLIKHHKTAGVFYIVSKHATALEAMRAATHKDTQDE